MRKLPIIAILALVLAAGCISDSTAGLEIALHENDNQASVHFDEHFFRRNIEVENVMLRRGATDFQEAKVLVRNRRKGDLPFQYKFVWFDTDGMEIQPDRPWEQALLHGREAIALSSTAPEKRGVKFVVRLRRIPSF